MTFISYAQNYEDVMLWRALNHIENGYYVDVGACSPDEYSITKAFYERGWHGISIEPHPEFHTQLEQSRLRDTSLCVAVGNHDGEIMMNFFDDSGLSTTDDTIAVVHKGNGWSGEKKEVKVITLETLWAQYVPAGQEVHFLKIDVEGFEEEVLRGNSWKKNRPWIVVFEATLPMTQTENYEACESILIAANYEFTYADGLNRFYVAHEHRELLAAFKYPPNVFDEFKLIALQETEARTVNAEARTAEAETQTAEAEARTVNAEARTAALLSSTSWRFTAPLRWLARLLRGEIIKVLVKRLLRHTAGYIHARPACRAPVMRVLRVVPSLERWLRRVVNTSATTVDAETLTVSSTRSPLKVPADLAHLTPNARCIYDAFKAAIAEQQNRKDDN